MLLGSSLVRELLLARVQVAHSWVAMARIAVGDVIPDAAQIIAISRAMHLIPTGHVT